MGGWIAIAVVTMMCAVLIQHLGLAEAIAGVVDKVAKCPKCMTFWLTVAVMFLSGADWFTAVSLSIFMSYASHYFGIVLILMQKIYSKLWEKMSE